MVTLQTPILRTPSGACTGPEQQPCPLAWLQSHPGFLAVGLGRVQLQDALAFLCLPNWTMHSLTAKTILGGNPQMAGGEVGAGAMPSVHPMPLHTTSTIKDNPW